MARSAIVQEYDTPPTTRSVTFSVDQKINHERLHNGITRPQGYTVSYHANPAVEAHHFGQSHPMKPWRLVLTKELVLAYGMHHAMDLYLSRAATFEEMAEFHTADYLEFLRQVIPADMEAAEQSDRIASYNFGDDCPIFDGLFDYCSLYSGATVDAARKLINNQADIAINWSGGLHHAKKTEASGFCYVNDIVLGILQLLRFHPRVMYIDIDVHHGDGVEQAFWSTDRVLTVSFHKYDKDNFFPGTGALDSNGPSHPLNPGSRHAINVPLNDGIEDGDYLQLYKDVISSCVETYQPGAIVLQCGADSLGCDRLGCFNLNVTGHGSCVAYTKTLGLPMLVVGGGGYTPRNVSRAWAHETSILIDAVDKIDPNIPDTVTFRNHFGPDFSLFPPLSEMRKIENKNSKQYLTHLVNTIREQLRYMQGAPSVQMSHIPPDILGVREEVEKDLEEEKDYMNEEREERDQGIRSSAGAAASLSPADSTSRASRRDLERGLGTRGELSA
ncbi:hypothetical protein EIK77_003453 [Talaromyces pinophilus]|jgi:histone deacetylase HOS2|uniref:Histone deacetylase n=1 Tax=Talaromyces pinophilus TaxID=128442 RepID=A0A6V8HEY8_TALPI|nr:putative histone deacetylase HOS2 [Talaromyces pinophilus]KAI7971397.1 hypothetical protein EIK77_003453 [Talaromyces pinophilus]PCH03355.1 Histone deacetylase superfamily [Penicillium occitanis (nom. inval.)]PCH07012.1 hypothetical protein PENOC_021170 [Penicillium occitanis (nom. inval.)]GAM36933.1 histone deacetylase [Talaromyces pinophilus]